MKNIFLNGKSIPRWVILILDIFLIIWAFTFSYFVISEFDFQRMARGSYLLYCGVLVLVSLPVMYLMRSFTGLLRYSNTTDVFRVFMTTLLINIVFFVVAVFMPSSKYRLPHIISLILINFFISSTALVFLRISAKFVFQSLIKRSNELKAIPVLIFGSDKDAVLIKHAFENSSVAQYDVKGFIDFNRNYLNKHVEQKRVYHVGELKALKEKERIEQLIMVNEELGEAEKKVLLDQSIKLGIKVVTIPPVTQWLGDGLRKKQIKDLKIEDLLQRKPIVMDKQKIMEGLCGKRILVTGAAGSIGSEIVKQVLKYNPEIVILCDQAESPTYELQMELLERFDEEKFEVVIGDVRNKDRMEKLFKVFQPEIVFHAAAYKHVPLMEDNPYEAIEANIKGTKNIADLSVAHGVEKFVMVSTDKAVNPTNVMGASKRIAEIYTQSLNNNLAYFKSMAKISGQKNETKFITTRFGNVLGSNGSVIPRFRHQIEKGGPVTVTHPEITRYFMTIPEAVELVLEAGFMGKGGEIFVFDMGEPVRIYDLAKQMIQLAGLEVGKDIDIVFSGLRPGEKLYEELLNEDETTMPTYHKKIKIAHVREYPFDEISEAIDKLIGINKVHNNIESVKQMKILVPEFHSNNSVFEELDDTLQNQLPV